MISLVIGTRASPLAVKQARIVANLLRKKNKTVDLRIKIKKIVTTGDVQIQRGVYPGTGKDMFTKSIDTALSDGQVDIAVHSLKDVPVQSSDSFEVAAFPKRDSPYDVLISKNGETLASLPKNARVGTSSVRRAIQIKSFRPDIKVVEIHGNIHTRLKKLGELDGIVLAKAGLNRLGISRGRVIQRNHMLPAVGQGCLAVVIRKGDKISHEMVSKIDDEDTRTAVIAERSFSRELGGGCNLPIASLGRIMHSRPKQVMLEGLVQSNGFAASRNLVARSFISGPAKDAELLGVRLARKMKKFVLS